MRRQFRVGLSNIVKKLTKINLGLSAKKDAATNGVDQQPMRAFA
jgi:hypothetical protein